MNINYDIGGKIQCGLWFDPKDDDAGNSTTTQFLIIVSKNGHMFRFNSFDFQKSKNTVVNNVNIQIQSDLMFDKLVIEKISSLSISKRKNQFLMSSSRNDLCVKSIHNDIRIYKMLDNNLSCTLLHP